MCDQIPDELILDGGTVSIEPLPIDDAFILRLPEEDVPVSTGHIRGYVARWELTDNRLYLIGVDGCYGLKYVGPIFAEWVSGTIRPAVGTYGEDFAIRIEEGRVLST